MKSPKAFFLCMAVLVVCILLFGWIRDTWFHAQYISPIARIKTIFIVIFGTVTMKLTLTDKAFKLFLITYIFLWVLYFGLKFMASHNIASFSYSAFSFYEQLVPLASPLPFIFFWVINRVFYIAEKKE